MKKIILLLLSLGLIFSCDTGLGGLSYQDLKRQEVAATLKGMDVSTEYSTWKSENQYMSNTNIDNAMKRLGAAGIALLEVSRSDLKAYKRAIEDLKSAAENLKSAIRQAR